MEEEKTNLTIEEPTKRAITYSYKDSYLPEAYPVYEARITSWWMDGGVKLYELMAHFKKRHTVKQACYFTGITEDQYRHFRSLHPWLVPTIRLYRSLVPMAISDVILSAALGKEEHLDKEGKKVAAVPGNPKIALGAARIYPNIEDDPDFATQDSPLAIPIGGSRATLVNEAVLDAEGKVIVTRDSVEIIQNHDSGSDNEG